MVFPFLGAIEWFLGLYTLLPLAFRAFIVLSCILTVIAATCKLVIFV